MGKRNLFKNHIFNVLIFFTGFSAGVILIWPGILTIDNRKCFFDILKDGSDGKVSLGTILSIEPNYLLKINKAETRYKKLLLIGDQCFRR